MYRRVFSRARSYPLLIAAITVVICILNYTPGTWLTGWDTLHPELNFPLNFARLVQGVWRPEQGLGALAGHSHMADLPRVVILWVLHFFFATQMLRYLYVFACFIVGPQGMYLLAQTLIPSARRHKSIALLGALFYIFNLSTAQQFYAPFEMFPTQWAALPWILLFAIQYIDAQSKKDRRKYLCLFALTTLLSTPQAYAAHLWYPFVAVFGLSIALYSLLMAKQLSLHAIKNALAKPLILAAIIVAVNGFWLFPNIYFIATGSQVPKDARQNRLFSQEYRIKNRENGYISDVALMRGFYLNWAAYDFTKSRFGPLMPNWEKHLTSPFVSGLGYGYFALVGWGAIQSIRLKNKKMLAQLPFILIPVSLLLNRTPPFEQLFNLLLHLSLFEEASRFIFTKLSILQLMGYAMFFTYALSTLKLPKMWVRLGAFFLAMSLFIYAFPLFKGDLIGAQFRIAVPKQYNEFWAFMKDQDDGRVLSLPVHTISGWQYYNWGYQGAGFLWFNLRQPLLDRDFDRWNTHNEQSFREFQYAVYSRRGDLFVQALNKYGVRYVVWDQSIITADPKNRKQTLFERETNELVTMLRQNGDLVKIRQFGTIIVYTTRRLPKAQQIQAISSNVQPVYQWNWTDSAFAQLGDYVTSDTVKTPFTYYYPLRNVVATTDRLNTNLTIDTNTTTLRLQTPPNGTYILPDLRRAESVIYCNIELQKRDDAHIALLFKPIIPGIITRPISYVTELVNVGSIAQTSINSSSFRNDLSHLEANDTIPLGQAYIYTNRENIINNRAVNLSFDELGVKQASSKFKLTLPSSKKTFGPDEIVLSASDRKNIRVVSSNQGVAAHFESMFVQNGSFLTMDDLPHNMGYILGVTARNLEGLPIRICLKNYYSETCNVYDELSKNDHFATDYFLVPPTDDGLGYGLSLDNISFGKAPSINEIREILVAPLPYEYLSQMRYRVESPGSNSPAFFIDNSSYHPGWIAFATSEQSAQSLWHKLFPALAGERLSTHVLINNWQNGWEIPEKYRADSYVTFTLIFWPQYLEYAGFFILFLTWVFLLTPTRFRRIFKKNDVTSQTPHIHHKTMPHTPLSKRS